MFLCASSAYELRVGDGGPLMGRDGSSYKSSSACRRLSAARANRPTWMVPTTNHPPVHQWRWVNLTCISVYLGDQTRLLAYVKQYRAGPQGVLDACKRVSMHLREGRRVSIRTDLGFARECSAWRMTPSGVRHADEGIFCLSTSRCGECPRA